jgi:hypothetical protein
MRKRTNPPTKPVLFYIGDAIPGAPGEIEYVIQAYADDSEVVCENFAVVSVDGRDIGVATFSTLVRDYAIARKLSLRSAEAEIERQAHEDVLLQYADDARDDGDSLWDARMDARF